MDLKEAKEETTGVAAFSHGYDLFRRALQLLFSVVSVVSLFLCYYYSQFSIFSQTLERKYVFLIFNGILAFLAKSLVQSSPPAVSVSTGSEFSFSSQTNAHIEVIPDETAVPVAVEEDLIDQVVEEEPEQAHADDHEYRGDAIIIEKEDIAMDVKQEADSEERTGSSSEQQRQEEEEEEEEEVDDLEYELEQPTATTAAADELNRRFEEFIRKMKEEIRIEAKRQLIVV